MRRRSRRPGSHALLQTIAVRHVERALALPPRGRLFRFLIYSIAKLHRLQIRNSKPHPNNHKLSPFSFSNFKIVSYIYSVITDFVYYNVDLKHFHRRDRRNSP